MCSQEGHSGGPQQLYLIIAAQPGSCVPDSVNTHDATHMMPYVLIWHNNSKHAHTAPWVRLVLGQLACFFACRLPVQ